VRRFPVKDNRFVIGQTILRPMVDRGQITLRLTEVVGSQRDRQNVTEMGLNQPGSAAIQRLMAGASAATGRGPAPVHLWNPPFCGDIAMRIAADGRWFYNGSVISRPAMVRLFATILRKDPDRYVLVTPVERVGITVDDAPFVAVEVDRDDGVLTFRTNLDDIVVAGADHPIRFVTADDGGLKPYVHVRGDLWALASRAVTHELVGFAVVEQRDDGAMFGVRSGGAFFVIAPANDLEGAV